MKKMFENKKWVALLGLAIVLVAALVIGIVAIAGGGEKEPNPTEGTSNVGVTDPTGTTGSSGNDVTDPTVTDPSTGTPENPDKPDDPEKPDDYVEPSEPDETIPEPTEPEPDPEPDPTDPDAPKPNEDPIVGTEYDFEGYTAGTITYDVWYSWDSDTREAFVDEFMPNITPEDYHHFMVQTKYKGYSCGFERHTCGTQAGHDNFMETLALGCPYCGKSDCDSFFVVNPNTLFTEIDHTQCPEYDIHKDSSEYCQTCGKPKGSGDAEKCIQYIQSAYCPICGEWVEGRTCHSCYEDD